MLYEALSQPLIFLWMTAGGFLCGFLFDARCVFLFLMQKSRLFRRFYMIFKHFFMFFAVFSAIFVFFALNLKLNYGQFRFFTVLVFSLSFVIQRFFVTNFLAKPIQKCYHNFIEKRRKKADGRKENNQSFAEQTTSKSD